MKKILTILLFSIVTLLAGQSIAPKKCNTCGKPLAQCQYKGRHLDSIAEEAKRKEEQRTRERENQRIAEQRSKEEADRKAREKNQVIQRLISNMVYVQGGTYTMGAASNQIAAIQELTIKDILLDDELPTHQVTVNNFYIGKYEVTQSEWITVMNNNPSINVGDNIPVNRVTWNECQIFIQKLNQMTGKKFRLPTEEEWEFAARGGNNSQGFIYCGSNNPNDVAWFIDNCEGRIHPVGQKLPNELGLYDMSGNVFEWCSTRYPNNYSKSDLSRISSSRRNRGGSWGSDAWSCRSSYRNASASDSHYNNIGLRIVLSE